MSFEEEFPSLKGRKIDYYLESGDIAFDKYDIQKYCLDKQRVKDIILKVQESYHCEGAVAYYAFDSILKELGLDE